jgi:hypothetical protein
MAARRTRLAPPVIYTPKTKLDVAAHPVIEAQLKKLKLASRQIREQLSLIETEARILERLYYKGKNQHRSATFWHRLSEVRRYTARINNLDLCNIIDSFRASFFGEAAQNKCAAVTL